MRGLGDERLAKRIEKKCEICQVTVKVKPSHQDIEGTYCSRACMTEGYKERLKGSGNPNWKGGLVLEPDYYKKMAAKSNGKAKQKRLLALRTEPHIPSEHEEQSRLVAECRRKGGQHANIFAVPNGGASLGGCAQARLKREGRTAGIPDLFLPEAAGGFHGMFLEMKKIKGNSATPEQVDWIGRLRIAGYCALVCRGCDAALVAIEDYLAGRIVGFGKKLYEYEVRS